VGAQGAVRKLNALPVLVPALLLAACASPRSELAELRLFAMGTWVDVAFEPVAGTDVDTVFREAEALLRSREVDWYAWADGELKALNRALQSRESMEVSAPLAELLLEARLYSARSDGTFEPGIAALVELWGFHSAAAEGADPDQAAIDHWLDTRAGIAELMIDGHRVSAARPGLAIDLGGIAKGKIVDQLLDLLEAHGIRNAMVNAGGDLATVGERGRRPWRIGIQNPRAAGVVAAVELEGREAVFTSGDYERYREQDGLRTHHLLDPRSGRPARHTMAVTVLSADATLADAAATALFIAGPQRWREVADQLDIRHALRVDASGAIEMTEAMAERIVSSRNAAGDLH
jgi:FAD:protein FMN transferase